MTSTLDAPVVADLTIEKPQCETCNQRPAMFLAKGCADKAPTHMCGQCLQRGLDVVRKYVQLYQRLNRKIMVCGDCYRPVLTLETHVEILEL